LRHEEQNEKYAVVLKSVNYQQHHDLGFSETMFRLQALKLRIIIQFKTVFSIPYLGVTGLFCLKVCSPKVI
jgi:hypothetical protein